MKKTVISILKGLLYFSAYFSTVIIAVLIIAFSCLCLTFFNEKNFGAIIETFEKSPNYTSTLSIISSLVFLLIICFFFKFRHKKIKKELHLNNISGKAVIPLLIFGIAFNFAMTYVFFELIPFPEIWYEDYMEAEVDFNGVSPVLSFLSIVIVASVVEEICFRGLIYTRFKQGMPLIVAAILTAILFGIGHGSPIWMLYTAISVFFTICFFEKFKSIIPCIIEHAGFNLVGWFAPQYLSNDPNIVFKLGMVVISILTFIWIMKMPIKKNQNIVAGKKLQCH